MKLKVAFICVHNSCRSQIAEALGKLFVNDIEWENQNITKTVKNMLFTPLKLLKIY